MKTDAKKILKISSLSVLLIFIIIYAFFISKDLLFGVKIKNVNINGSGEEQTVFTESIIKITGNARNAKELSLNDRPISIDQKGNFEETLALLSGYNIVKIEAKDEFGSVDEKTYKLIKN